MLSRLISRERLDILAWGFLDLKQTVSKRSKMGIEEWNRRCNRIIESESISRGCSVSEESVLCFFFEPLRHRRSAAVLFIPGRWAGSSRASCKSRWRHCKGSGAYEELLLFSARLSHAVVNAFALTYSVLKVRTRTWGVGMHATGT